MSRLRNVSNLVLSGRANVAVLVVVIVLAALSTAWTWGILITTLCGVGAYEIGSLLLKKNLRGRQEYLPPLAMLAYCVMLAGFFFLRLMPNGFALCFQLVIAIWAFDTFALMGGSISGQFWETHKILPQASPKKSWEGYFAGLAAGVGSLVVTGWLLSLFHVSAALTLANWLVVVITLTIGHTGDFIESAFKRWVGEKDSGTILRGHGGILDRFDAFTFAGFAFFIMMLARLV